MAIRIKNGQNELTLKKSSNLVGLQTKETVDNIEESNYVDQQVHQNIGGFNVVKLKREGEDIDTKLDEVRGKEEVKVGTHVYYTASSNRPVVPTGEIIIQFQDATSSEEQNLALSEYHLVLVDRKDEYTVIAKVTPDSPNPLKVANYLEQISMVKWAEPDLDTPLDEYNFVRPDDNLLDHQWHLKNTGFVADANWRLRKDADAKVVDAWNRLGNMGSSNVTVAIIDNGFDVTHPDLKAKIHRPFDNWSNSTRIPGKDSGYSHGTPCASVALAASNGKGIVGAAPNAKFMPINGTSFSSRATERMFDYCIENGADIISCSWGTTDPNFSLNSIKKAAITKAARQGRGGKGCVVLFAVGNDDFDFVNFYAAHPDVIAVAASTSQDKHASYSNRGREVSICAPSNGDWPIIAGRAWWDEGVSWETGTYRYWRDGRSRGDHYKHFGGTSSACPLVAGICALILSANPNLTAKEVKEILQKTADKIGSPSEYVDGHSSKYGYGRINADRAIAEALRRKDAQSSHNFDANIGTSSSKGLFRFGVQQQAGKGWGVQIGAFADYGNVLIQAERMERQFKAPVIVNINEVDGRTVYKMVIGAFANIDEARALEQRMEANGVKGFLRNLKDLS
ncbi:MAG: S8 family serine peptidase [Bacteroidota bacterium]